MARCVRSFALATALMGLAGCGGSPSGPTADRTVASSPPETAPEAPPPRQPIEVISPRLGATVPAVRRADRFSAVARLTGRGAPRQLIELLGTCGKLECDAIALADRRGRWKATLQLNAFTERDVTVRVRYARPRPGDRPTVRLLALRAADGAPPAAAALPGEPGRLLVIGDSLAVGVAQALRDELGDWQVSVDARVGRPLAEGMGVLGGAQTEGTGRTVLAFSLFTNDSPGAVDDLVGAVRGSVAALEGSGCAVWATIARPAVRGVGYERVNRALLELAAQPDLRGRLLVVDWAAAAARRPEWLVADGVHATAEGYAARARLYADAVRSCRA